MIFDGFVHQLPDTDPEETQEWLDRAVLDALCARFGGGPVGLTTLAIAVSEPPETVEDVYEPFLIQRGLLMRTPRGRVATAAAFEHLGLTPLGVVTVEDVTRLFE